MDERPTAKWAEAAETRHMSPLPAVSCTGCGFAWNSAAMADGLRALGACPKCGGELSFNEASRREDRFEPVAERGRTAPHLVLGIPRR
jgi:hypothetical protein